MPAELSILYYFNSTFWYTLKCELFIKFGPKIVEKIQNCKSLDAKCSDDLVWTKIWKKSQSFWNICCCRVILGTLCSLFQKNCTCLQLLTQELCGIFYLRKNVAWQCCYPQKCPSRRPAFLASTHLWLYFTLPVLKIASGKIGGNRGRLKDMWTREEAGMWDSYVELLVEAIFRNTASSALAAAPLVPRFLSWMTDRINGTHNSYWAGSALEIY